jgi:uncharacterized protein YkwD
VPRRPLEAIALLVGFWLGLTVFLPLAAGPAFSSERSGSPELALLESELHRAVNAYRAEQRLIPLERRPDLDAVARAHSADMAGRGYLAHRAPEGHDWVGRLALARIEGFTMAGENVGLTSRPDPNDEVLRGWIHSPVHRENLTARPYNATGLGIARAADGTFYYTQLYLSFPAD